MVININKTHITEFFSSKAMFNIKVTEDVQSDSTHLLRDVVIEYNENYFLRVHDKEDIEVLKELLIATCAYIERTDERMIG